MKFYPKKCPCGCKNIIMEPFFGCQCSSVDRETAHKLTVRLNAFDDLVARLLKLATEEDRSNAASREALEFVAGLMLELDAEPSFG